MSGSSSGRVKDGCLVCIWQFCRAGLVGEEVGEMDKRRCDKNVRTEVAAAEVSAVVVMMKEVKEPEAKGGNGNNERKHVYEKTRRETEK